MFDNVWLIPLFPLIGFLINGLLGKKIKNETVIGSIGALAVLCSFVVSVMTFLNLIGLPAEERSVNVKVFTWITAGHFTADVAFLIDPLSCLMLLVVTGIGFLIHVYSIGYMHGEEGFYRFFAYLNLFVFSMLLLVTGNNLLLMFVGWEGVGLCSYLLIGYYFHKKSAGDAGKKAFVMNRVGDFGFLLGLFTLFWWFGQTHNIWTIQFTELAKNANLLPTGGVVTVITLCFFLGATGKSAQIPLYTWLPDAMEGPTPVSALIHAATMVTAGVYMIGRMSFLFIRSPETMTVVALVGGCTALFAATIGTAQNDIKRVLAYSTVSQLGYMFLAMGVGAFTAGIFHLMTHAFFKGLLFLAAGSVIHSLSGQQDIRQMGGLWKKIPITFWTMTAAVFAISGIIPFSGFFSKDEILYQTFISPNPLAKLLWLVGLVTAGLTSFYMFRLWFKTFFGKPRFDEHETHVHESSLVMTLPLMVLAILSIIGGWVGIPAALGGHNNFVTFLDPVFASASVPAVEAASHGLELTLAAVSLLTATLGIFVAWLFYYRRPGTAAGLAKKFAPVYSLLDHKYWVDEIYGRLLITPLLAFSRLILGGLVDAGIVQGTGSGLAATTRGGGWLVRRIQSGNIRSYAGWLAAGAAAVIAIVLFGHHGLPH